MGNRWRGGKVLSMSELEFFVFDYFEWYSRGLRRFKELGELTGFLAS
jgi:hypothetical protein